ncbi:MAG: glycerol-3-phosphate acyltransferase [Acutalibacteraceae bacterium]
MAVIGLFIVVFAIWRMVSLGSVIAAGTYPIATFLLFFTDYYHGGIVSLKYVLIVTAITALMGGIVIFKHRGNIVRIMNGTEKSYLEIKKKFKYEKTSNA